MMSHEQIATDLLKAVLHNIYHRQTLEGYITKVISFWEKHINQSLLDTPCAFVRFKYIHQMVA